MQDLPSKKCPRCGAPNSVVINICRNCFYEIPSLIAPPIGCVVGKVIEINKQGFRLKTTYGNECQVDANYEWRGIIEVGDEVNVKGGTKDGIFLMAWMSVFRSGQWLHIEDFRKKRNWLKPWTWLKF
jgi:hypothetical protein